MDRIRVPHVVDCPHCEGKNTVHHPSVLWRWSLIPAWVLVTAVGAASSLIGPFITVLIPFMAIWAVCLLGGLYARADELPTCERCGKIPVRVPAPPRRLPTRVSEAA